MIQGLQTIFILRKLINGRQLNDYYLDEVTRFAFGDITVTS